MGLIESEWKIEERKFNLTVSIPPNTSAEVWLRSKEGSGITESGEKITPLRCENGYVLVEVGSGKYQFQSSYQ